MKVLHINSSRGFSGAAIAAERLHQGLIAQGVESRWLVGGTQMTASDTATIPRRQKLESLIWHFTWRLGLNDVHAISSFSLPQNPWFVEADVLNFHNLHTGYFNYLALPRLTQDKPAIYTLHDMWSFTGHCIYSYDCERWRTGCGKCPYPKSYPAVTRDTTHLEWKWKKHIYERSNLIIVTLSSWLTEQVQQSILGSFPVHHIPNGIDTTVYQPIDPEYCRSVLGIAGFKKVLMFSAQSLSDPRKGGDLLVKTLQKLPDTLKAETLLLTLGDANFRNAPELGMETLNLGFVNHDKLKAIAYSAADLFIFPSRADNLPLVLQESMACGTPMVSFKIGGIPDLVRHNVTGYLAEPENSLDLCAGTVKLLEDNQARTRMSLNCREVALTEYSLNLQAQRYIHLYQQALNFHGKQSPL